MIVRDALSFDELQ